MYRNYTNVYRQEEILPGAGHQEGRPRHYLIECHVLGVLAFFNPGAGQQGSDPGRQVHAMFSGKVIVKTWFTDYQYLLGAFG